MEYSRFRCLAVARPFSVGPLPIRPSFPVIGQDLRHLAGANLPVRIQTRGGAPLRALCMYEVPCGDTKTYVLTNFDPTIHVGVGNPRIKSEPVLVGAIAWAICWKLRLTALPLLPKYKLLGPAPDD